MEMQKTYRPRCAGSSERGAWDRAANFNHLPGPSIFGQSSGMPHTNNLPSFGTDPATAAAAAAAAAAAHHQVFGLLATGATASGGAYGSTPSSTTPAGHQTGHSTSASSGEYLPPSHLGADGCGGAGSVSGWNVGKATELSAGPWGHHPTFNGFDNYNHSASVMAAGEMFAGMGSHHQLHHHHQGYSGASVSAAAPASVDGAGATGVKNPANASSPFSPYGNAAAAYRNYNLAKAREINHHHHHHGTSAATSFGFY